MCKTTKGMICLHPLIIVVTFAIIIIVLANMIDRYRERAGLPEFEPPKYSDPLLDYASWRQYQSDHERTKEDASSD
jgi:hypothetical protein